MGKSGTDFLSWARSDHSVLQTPVTVLITNCTLYAICSELFAAAYYTTKNPYIRSQEKRQHEYETIWCIVAWHRFVWHFYITEPNQLHYPTSETPYEKAQTKSHVFITL